MASGWNLWVCLECIGVVTVVLRCCKEVYRFPHNITYPCIPHLYCLYFAAAFLLICSFFKRFFVFV